MSLSLRLLTSFFYCTIPCVLYFHLMCTVVRYIILYSISSYRKVTLYILTQSPLWLCRLCHTRALPVLLLLALVRTTFSHKPSPPGRRDQMRCALSCCKNCQNHIDNDQYILLYNDLDLYNNYISMEQRSTDRCSINFPRHCVLGHVLLDTNPLDEVDSWKEVVRPSKNPRSVDPHKLKSIQTLKKTMNNKKTH